MVERRGIRRALLSVVVHLAPATYLHLPTPITACPRCSSHLLHPSGIPDESTVPPSTSSTAGTSVRSLQSCVTVSVEGGGQGRRADALSVVWVVNDTTTFAERAEQSHWDTDQRDAGQEREGELTICLGALGSDPAAVRVSKRISPNEESFTSPY